MYIVKYNINKKHMKIFRFFILISLLYSCNIDRNAKDQNLISFSEKNYEEAFQLIDYWLDAQKDYENIPGINAMVGNEDGIVWSGAYGLANDIDTISIENTFSICSISKLFTSVAIMKLVEEKKLNLNDTIGKILPWFDLKQQFENSTAITIKSILTHSSGLPRESNHPYWTSPDFPFPTKDAVIKELKNQEMLYPSSKYYQYSNLGLTLLGYVIEEISGESFDDYIAKNIFDPLSMSYTKTYMSEKEYGDLLSVGYSSIKRDREREKVNFFNANGIAAAAGFTSNVEDLGKFATWQLQLLKSSGKKIISSETLKEMHKIHWNDKLTSVTRGLGFGVYKLNGEKFIGHSGSCPGYRSSLVLSPEIGVSYLVMINSSGINPVKYIVGIDNILKKVTKHKDSISNKFKELEGKYNHQPWGSEFYVQSWGDNLAIMEIPSENPYLTLYKKTKKDFFKRILENDDLGEELEVLRDENNVVIGFKSHQNIFHKIK